MPRNFSLKKILILWFTISMVYYSVNALRIYQFSKKNTFEKADVAIVLMENFLQFLKSE